MVLVLKKGFWKKTRTRSNLKDCVFLAIEEYYSFNVQEKILQLRKYVYK
jgi:hypothetical protein